MKIIAALGNPGTKYQNTRHNAGWIILDWLIKNLGFKIEDLKMNSKFNTELLDANGVLLIKPHTYMNNSGEAIQKICDFYKVDTNEDLLVIHDDKDLVLGKVRFTDSSSSAGQNGVQNIINMLGTQNFRRVRIGIESREQGSPIPTLDFVLQNFTEDELKKLRKDVFPKIKLEIEKFIGN